MESSELKTSFSRVRQAFWPVHSNELKKLLAMLLIFFFISFDYNILRIMKDTLVVASGKQSGAEAIPFIKVWVMFPGALILTAIFSSISNRASKERLFYLIISLFLLFFLFFAIVLFPMREALHPHEFADKLQLILPKGCKGLVLMIRNWTFTLFYAMSELWSNIILSLTFWGFANQVTKLSEAKRFYGLFGIGANFSGIAAGTLSAYVTAIPYNPANPLGSSAWEQSFFMLVALVLIAGLFAMLVFRYMITNILPKEDLGDKTLNQLNKVQKSKLSVKENLQCVFKSPYLTSIALIVFSYNIVINLVEVVWKQQVKELYADPNAYHLYMSHVTTAIGVLATFASLFLSGNALRILGFKTTALLTPLVLFITSIGFFFFFFMNGKMDALTLSLFGVTPLSLVVFFGTAQNVLSRAAKYTVFDATKEMSFIPLSSEEKFKGKAAIDGIISKLGKSGGSVIHQTLLLFFVTINNSTPFVAIILFGMIGVWTASTHTLGNMFQQLEEKEPERAVSQETSVQPA